MKDIQQFLKKAANAVSNTVDEPVKIAYALMRMSHLVGISKISSYDTIYTDDVINTAVQQHFRAEGLENPPDLPWASIFKQGVKKMAVSNRWSKEYEEQIMSAVFQDILMGQNIDSFDVDKDTGDLDFSAGQWKQGNLANQIRKWQAKGKNETDMERMLRSHVTKKAENKDRKFTQRQRGEGGHSQLPFDHTDTFDTGPEGGDSNVILNLLEMDPMTRSEASTWMNIAENNPAIRNFLRLIDKRVKQTQDDRLIKIWKAIKDYPDFKNKSDLARNEVTYFDRDKGRVLTKPLYMAIDVDEPRKVDYHFRKLRKVLESLKPEALELLSA